VKRFSVKNNVTHKQLKIFLNDPSGISLEAKRPTAQTKLRQRKYIMNYQHIVTYRKHYEDFNIPNYLSQRFDPERNT